MEDRESTPKTRQIPPIRRPPLREMTVENGQTEAQVHYPEIPPSTPYEETTGDDPSNQKQVEEDLISFQDEEEEQPATPPQEDSEPSNFFWVPNQEQMREEPQSTPSEDPPRNEEEQMLRCFNLPFENLTPLTYTVNRHITITRKMLDWGLSVRKKWLFLGDSNLAKIPPYSIEDLQIDSYPGANFLHIHEVMSKATVHVTVEKVLLSFGINSKGQKPKQTLIEQVQTALRTAKKCFPSAEIWIPLINFKPNLTTREQDNPTQLNSHIQKNIPFTPPLDQALFQTTQDDVHWTKETAQEMFNYWTSYLNLKTPRAR